MSKKMGPMIDKRDGNRNIGVKYHNMGRMCMEIYVHLLQ